MQSRHVLVNTAPGPDYRVRLLGEWNACRMLSWQELCLKAVKEPDPKKQTAIVVELNRILQNQIKRAHAARVRPSAELKHVFHCWRGQRRLNPRVHVRGLRAHDLHSGLCRTNDEQGAVLNRFCRISPPSLQDYN